MFKTLQECEEKKYETINTNSRYKDFHQDIFTAGDQEQFFSKIGIPEDKDVIKTFKFIYNKYKKGIFVVIKNNKLDVFLPFDNRNFINDYSKYIDTTNYRDLVDKVSYKKQNIKPFINWYSNNGIFRYEYNKKEIDKTSIIFKNMFEELCKDREIPDCYFFINRRDFPWLRKDRYEAFDNIYGDKMMDEEYQGSFSPIFSMTSNDKYDDIAIPTWEDWVKSSDMYFSACIRKEQNINKDFDSKIHKAVFRGTTTGIGYNSENNIRMKLCKMKDEYLDVGITKINNRIRKIKGDRSLHYITEDIETKQFIPFSQQTNYRYIINLDGYVSAFRLSEELESHSVLLLQDSEYKTWYRQMLKPYEEYLPLKNDLRNLNELIEFAEGDDVTCKRIISNANNFYEKHLSKSGIFDYLECVCKSISNTYTTRDIQKDDFNLNFQLEDISTIEYNLLKSSINSKVYSNGEYIIKESKNDLSKEIYIYLNCINNIHKFHLPKLDSYTKHKIKLKEIKGITLIDFIRFKFDMNKFINILIKLVKMYDYMYKKYNFIHYDSYPWNIIIMNNNPYLIDFEKSYINGIFDCIRIDGKHSKFQDIITVLFNSISFILKCNKLSTDDINKIYKIIRFFDTPHFNNMKDLRSIKEYLNTYKRFDYIVNIDLDSYEKYTIQEFITFLENLNN